jgi:hypothetical protein
MTMNIYQRLNQARQDFHNLKIEKTGHNKFAGYKYFELGDFLIPALSCFRLAGLSAVISYGKEFATMKIVNVTNPTEVIEITSPMAGAALKGAHDIQNLGAVETYTRRYLWVTAMEIVEHDALDASEPLKKITSAKHSPVPDVELDDEAIQRMTELSTDIVIAFEEGRELDCIELYYHQITDNDEKIYVWKLLSPHTKLRSFLKANKPQAVTA